MSMQQTSLEWVRVSERLDGWEVRGETRSGYAIEITGVSKRRVPDPYGRACALAVEQCRALGLDCYLVERFTRRRPAEFLRETVQIETGGVIDSQVVYYG
jgi:hypothetical protein